MIALLFAASLLSSPAPAETPAALVSRFHDALKGGRRQAVLDLMTPDAVVFESGGAENTRDEYANHHLEPDMAFARSTVTTVEDRRVVEMGDVALVLSHTATSGAFEGKPVSSKGVETMVVRRVDGGWRVAHIHWSTRRLPPPGSPFPGGTPPAPGAAPNPASPPVTSPGPPAGAGPRDHWSAARFASELKAAGLKVERKGAIDQPFFAVPAQVLAIGADEIHVFEFASEAAAEKAAGTVSADGGTIGTSAMHWMAPPRFHRRGPTILIHLGRTAAVRAALERFAGAPFAGRP